MLNTITEWLSEIIQISDVKDQRLLSLTEGRIKVIIYKSLLVHPTIWYEFLAYFDPKKNILEKKSSGFLTFMFSQLFSPESRHYSAAHRWYIEPRNREKVLHSFDNVFHVYLMNWLQKYQKKIFFWRWLFEINHIIRFEIWDLRSRDLKKILGYDINYLSIWPFMRHPWYPTRKA